MPITAHRTPFPAPKRCASVGLGLFWIPALLACGRLEADTTRLDPVALAAEPVVIAAGAQAFDFRSEPALAWVGDSAIAVVDLDDGQIVVQPLYGGAPRRLGRKGHGPGEFQLPTSLLADARGELLVADARTMRISRFDAALQFVGSQPTPAVPLHLLRRSGDRVLGLWVLPSGIAPVISEVDLGSGQVHEAWYPFDVSAELAQSAEFLTRSPFLAAAFDPLGERLLLSGNMEYRIFGFGPNRSVLTSFGRPGLAREPHSVAEKEEIRARMARMMNGMQDAPEMRRMIETVVEAPKPHFRSQALSVDEAGRVWVVTERTAPEGTLVDVFDPSGALTATLPLRDRVLKIAHRADMIAALVERRGGPRDGQFGLDVYRIRTR